MAHAPFRVFYSYSHKDVRMLDRLRRHMAMLRRQGLITEWYDREIEAGSAWRREIERELEAADVILLLVSADFLASDFCYEQEMTRAVERARRGEAVVIGVMLRPVDGWDATPFAEFQVVPRGARPITRWSDTDEGYSDAVERIRTALQERAAAGDDQRRRGSRSPARGTPRAEAESAEPATVSDTTPLDDAYLTAAQLALLDRIEDPEQRERERQQMIMQRRQEMLRAVAQNFRT